MIYLRSAVFGICLSFSISTPSGAVECSRISTAEVQAALKDADVPKALLTMAHIDVTRFDYFLECPPQTQRLAFRYLYSVRNLEPPYYEGAYFTFYKFATPAIRDKRLSAIMSRDSEAVGNPDVNVFYYVPPGRGDAVRVMRRKGVPID